MDSMKQQMLELCRSDTLSRTRQQHDRDLAVMKEQHDAALLMLQQKLDSTAQALDEQVCSETAECSNGLSELQEWGTSVSMFFVISRWTLLRI